VSFCFCRISRATQAYRARRPITPGIINRDAQSPYTKPNYPQPIEVKDGSRQSWLKCML
jgi:hypothetical protein